MINEGLLMGLFTRIKEWQVNRNEIKIAKLTEKAADLKEDQPYDLLFLYERGFVRAKGSGQSITKLHAEVENLIRKKLNVTVAPGTYFVSSSTHQNMVTTIDYSFTLHPCSSQYLEIKAACINADRPIPGKSDRFNGVARVSENISRFLEASRNKDPMVIQAGVWALTDNYSRTKIKNHLFSRDQYGNITYPITDNHINKAAEILDQLNLPHFLGEGTYEGESRNDVAHGKGRYISNDGTIYDGEWNNGNRHGFGKKTFSEGYSYEGEFKNNKMDGFGTYLWPNGAKYIGKYHEGNEIGGWYYYANGEKRWMFRNSKGEWEISDPPE